MHRRRWEESHRRLPQSTHRAYVSRLCQANHRGVWGTRGRVVPIENGPMGYGLLMAVVAVHVKFQRRK